MQPGKFLWDLLNVGGLSSYHPHFRIEVLFFGTIFKNSIYILKKQKCSAGVGVVAECILILGMLFESQFSIFILFRNKKKVYELRPRARSFFRKKKVYKLRPRTCSFFPKKKKGIRTKTAN